MAREGTSFLKIGQTLTSFQWSGKSPSDSERVVFSPIKNSIKGFLIHNSVPILRLFQFLNFVLIPGVFFCTIIPQTANRDLWPLWFHVTRLAGYPFEPWYAKIWEVLPLSNRDNRKPYVFSKITARIKRHYYSFKTFPQSWLDKSTRMIHHNQLLMTKFGRILCLTRKWRQKCSPLRVKAPLTEKTWVRGWVVLLWKKWRTFRSIQG